MEVGSRNAEVGNRNSEVGPVVVPKKQDYAAARMRKCERERLKVKVIEGERMGR